MIRLEDKDGLEWLYVGQTSNILSRLGAHVNEGGDSSSLSHKKMRVCDLEETRTDIDEHEHYRETLKEYDLPNDRIVGGR